MVPRPSDNAVDRRLRRVLAPNAAGEFRVSEKIRTLFADPGDGRKKVIKLFEGCGWDKDRCMHPVRVPYTLLNILVRNIPQLVSSLNPTHVLSSLLIIII